MNKHTESIIVFGLVVPAILLAAILAAVIVAGGKLSSATEQKLATYRDHEQAIAALQSAEVEFAGQSEGLHFWKENLSKELIQTLTANLREAMAEYTDDQLRQTELGQPNDASQFASVTQNKFDRFRLSFEGGFAPMQRVLAELETRMPQLALETLSVGPSTQAVSENGLRHLRFVVTYLSWRDEK